MPAIDQVDLADPSETPPDMLGLFVGRNELEIDETAGAQLPPRIHLFQRNIERACRDPEHLVTEIRKTLYHEIGHMLGFDEEGVAELGLE